MQKLIVFLLVVSMHFLVRAANGPTRDEVVRLVSKEAHEILGQRRGDFIVPHELVADALVSPLGVPEPDGVREISANIFLVAGCRPHSCDEKAIAIADVASSRILASGLRHFHCRRELAPDSSRGNVKDQVSCDSSPTLTIFLYKYKNGKRSVLSDDQLIENIRTWASNVGGGAERLERILVPR